MIKLTCFAPLLGLVLMSFSLNLAAQTQQKGIPEDPEKTEKAETTEVDDPFFVIVENMPKFPGGEQAMMTYLQENLTYPVKAREARIQGSVFVSFIVERDGKLSTLQVVRGVGGGLDEEALRVVKNMPPWEPGTQGGEAVRVQFFLPIFFTLN